MKTYQTIEIGDLFKPGDILDRDGTYHAKFRENNKGKGYTHFGIYPAGTNTPIWEILLKRKDLTLGIPFLRVTKDGAEIIERPILFQNMDTFQVVLWQYKHNRVGSTSNPFLYLGDKGEFVLHRRMPENFCILMTKGAEIDNNFLVQSHGLSANAGESGKRRFTTSPIVNYDLGEGIPIGTEVVVDKVDNYFSWGLFIKNPKITYIDQTPAGARARTEDYKDGFTKINIELPYRFHATAPGDRRSFANKDRKDYNVVWITEELSEMLELKETIDVGETVKTTAEYQRFINFEVSFLKFVTFNLFGELIRTYIPNEDNFDLFVLPPNHMEAQLERPYKFEFNRY